MRHVHAIIEILDCWFQVLPHHAKSQILLILCYRRPYLVVAPLHVECQILSHFHGVTANIYIASQPSQFLNTTHHVHVHVVAAYLASQPCKVSLMYI